VYVGECVEMVFVYVDGLFWLVVDENMYLVVVIEY